VGITDGSTYRRCDESLRLNDPILKMFFSKNFNKKASNLPKTFWELLMVRHIDGATNRFDLATQYSKCFSQKTSIKKASDFSEACGNYWVRTSDPLLVRQYVQKKQYYIYIDKCLIISVLIGMGLLIIVFLFLYLLILFTLYLHQYFLEYQFKGLNNVYTTFTPTIKWLQ